MTVRRRIVITAAASALCVAGAAAATVLGGTGTPVPSHGVLEPGGLAGVRGSDSVDRVVRDARGRDWGVTVFKAKNGQTCAARGRLVGGKVGTINPRTGEFAAYPIEDGASCGDLSEIPAGVQVGFDAGGPTTVHGIAGPTVRTVTVTVGGETRELPLGPRGGFLAILPEGTAIEAVKVTATLKDESVVQLFG